MIDITTLESVWSKCPWCKSEYTIVDDDFGQPVHPNMIRYCWHCGSPLTHEAVEEMAGRLPTLTPLKEATYPCDLCVYNPPSSLDGKPCTYCPATGRPPEGEEET